MGRIVNISGTKIKDHGIRVLTDYVKKNLPDEYTLVLGCKPYTSDVDAVLIGRGSTIFAIEAKDWKGNIRARSYGLWEKDGTLIENPLSQARNNAVALAKWLRNRIGQDRLSEALGSPGKLWVTSLLVFTNPKCSIDDTGLDRTSNTGVKIMGLDNLKDFALQQEGDERIGQMVRQAFDSLNADARSMIRKENRKGSIAALIVAIIGICLCISYLIWSTKYDKSGCYIPLGVCIIIMIASINGIVNPKEVRRTPYCKRKTPGFSSPNSVKLSEYGQANAVLTNYIVDGIDPK